MKLRSLIIAGLVLVGASSGWAQEKEGEKENGIPSEDQVVVTRHSVIINGVSVAYTATAGTLVLKEEDGTARASVFYIAYTRDDVADPSTRPLTFSFNGGPGSSSVWLHMGVLGPRRVLMDDDGNAPAPPYRLVDNAHSLLDVSDLVFIDPVSTGYSRAVPESAEPKEFHGVQEDIESVGAFIRLFVTRNQRWGSPKFLIGESYGTTRAAGLAGHLQQRHGLYLNGIMLVSSVLEFQTIRFHTGNDLPFVMFLPSYAATAWYHGKLERELQERPLPELLDEVEAFALERYAVALMKGASLPEAQWDALAADLARYTGLSRTFVERSDYRIPMHRFVKELRRDERRTVGRLDSRFTGIDRDAAGEGYEYDPSYSEILGPYTATLNDYLRRELEFESDLPYEILTGRVRPWNYGEYQNRYVNVAETLRRAMNANPDLRVFVANGYYDLATPYFATEYTVNRLGLDPALRDHITMAYYEGGHMMYIHQPSLRSLKADLANFVDLATP